MYRPAAFSLAAFLGLAVSTALHAAPAENDEAARLRKLEQAVAALQKENAELKQEIRQTSAPVEVAPATSKIKLSDSVTELRLYGEGRLRYFFNDGAAAGLDSGDHANRERLRYRLRLGADIKVHENWMIGVLVEENNSARSSNVTLGENPVFAKGTVLKDNALTGATITGTDAATGKTITGTAATGLKTTKGSVVTNVNFGDALFLGRVFLKTDPFPWLSLEGGRIPNPFITTRMVWDPDINPEGFGEQFRFTFQPHGVRQRSARRYAPWMFLLTSVSSFTTT